MRWGERREYHVGRDTEQGGLIYLKVLTSHVRKPVGVASFLVKIWIRDPPPPNMFIYNVIMIWCLYSCSMGLGTNTVTNYDIIVTSDFIRLRIFANKIPKPPLARSTLFETEQSLHVNIKSEAALFLFILKEPTVQVCFSKTCNQVTYLLEGFRWNIHDSRPNHQMNRQII